jgi:DNA polymerase III subunit delta'
MSEGLNFDWPIIGHDSIKKFLQLSILNKSLAHAYVFYGSERVGKTTTAKVFAKSILCTHYKEYTSLSAALGESKKITALPCNECESCLQFEKGLYADFYLLEREINEKTGDKKKNITVSQIRSLQEKIGKRAFMNSYKIVIIKEAETLTKGASNSLLKTLEEPTSKTILILIGTSKELMLDTILSRCQAFKFLPIIKESVYQYLLNGGTSRPLANELANLSQGRPTVALRFMESMEALAAYKEKNSNWLNLFKKDNVDKFKFIDTVFKTKPSVDSLTKDLNELSGLVRDLLLVESHSSNLLSHIYLENELGEIAQKNSESKLIQMAKNIELTKKYLKQNINPKLALENLIINI